MACVYAASLCAAAILSICHEGIVPLTTAFVARTLTLSGGNFAIAFWFTLIPRTLGIAAALGVLAVRTYMQLTGHLLPPLF